VGSGATQFAKGHALLHVCLAEKQNTHEKQNTASSKTKNRPKKFIFTFRIEGERLKLAIASSKEK
jgi:hypothetical protein